MEDKLIEWAKELQSLAQAGLWYGHDDFDKERYQRIRDISAEMMSERTDLPKEKVRDLFCDGIGYQTPKVDTRAAIFKEDKILLVCERSGKWSLPGGWCDYNMSPAENTIKEAKEEAGLDVTIEKLIAVQDREKHNEPPYAYKVVKIFFLCTAVAGAFSENIETSDSRYFAEDQLPDLAEEKTSAEQIRMCFEACRDKAWAAKYD
ncbi:MAG: NUDIX hydrolase [Blautia sp.]|nr:NUDIX hydrolase [Blautia sp.]